jgi:hypothetical protein
VHERLHVRRVPWPPTSGGYTLLHVARYDALRAGARVTGAPEVYNEMLERLRALGYLE